MERNANTLVASRMPLMFEIAREAAEESEIKMTDKPYLEPDHFDAILGTKHRYELLSGEYGPYFYDSVYNHPMTIEAVLDRLNEIDDLKARLFAANKRKRGKKW